MAFVRLKSLLLLSRLVVGLLLFSTFVFTVQLIGQTYDVATGGPEVRLTLNTFSPNLFPALHDVKAGFDDGRHGRPRRDNLGPLTALQAPATGFELAANPRESLLRYREPTPWKRVTLFYLGASDSLFSLPWLLFLGLGSWLLWRLLLDVTPDTPFTFANARRLGQLALLVLGLSVWEKVAYALVRALVPAFGASGLAETLNHLAECVGGRHTGHHRRGVPARRGAEPRSRTRYLMPIIVNLDVMLARRKMTLSALAEAVGITLANLSILKSGKAKAVRFSTLAAICQALDCQPGDLLEHSPDPTDLRPGADGD
jgi:DNA-binding Xre family transcriptional regulator